ncbi:MAG: helix-turn-helix domain-containing protein [Oscillospiraceae bacterium]|jgi:AraC-like DNA-binding protein|nr:helix-turn-helix domain-containing protein [Oscillospiraceae bacterium]
MERTLADGVTGNAVDLSAALGVFVRVFCFEERAFLPGSAEDFCLRCPLACGDAAVCDSLLAHRFGCYEAVRWHGEYIYYCPAGLIFVATLVAQNGRPALAFVTGPVVMGQADDWPEFEAHMQEAAARLPQRTPAQVNAVARVLALLAAGFGRQAPPAEEADSFWEDVRGPGGLPKGFFDAIDVQQQLSRMIRQGDRGGTAQMINQLLGALYLGGSGNLPKMKDGARELLALFHRAAKEGGAFVDPIFGQSSDFSAQIAGCATQDSLSAFLVDMFNRFVGYVFDFTRFAHADALGKAAEYIRQNAAEKITLAGVAREVGFSPSHLSAVWSSEMRVGFSAYVQTVRIEKAKQLLRKSGLPLVQVAQNVGFSDQSYFTKVFTRLCGVSPAQYRSSQIDQISKGA